MKTMDCRQLGFDGPKVPVLGFGAWGLSGKMGSISLKQAEEVMNAALDAGFTFIDTAEGYAHSESVIGKVIQDRRDGLFLATKVSGDQSPSHMAYALENSLKNLKTDYVDLYQLHRYKPDWPLETVMEQLVRFQDQGKIRYIGLSNFTPEQVTEASEHGPIQSVQTLYNMLQRVNGETLIPWCKDVGIGVLVYSPLGKGLLTGTYKPGVQFESTDIRSEDSIRVWKGENYRRIFAVTERLREWAEDHSRDIVQLAIAWTLANQNVCSSLVGARDPDQVYQNAHAASWRLTDSNLIELEKIQAGFTLPHDRW